MNPLAPSSDPDAVIAAYLMAEEAGVAPNPAAVIAAHPAHRRILSKFLDAHHGLRGSSVTRSLLPH